MKIAIISDTHDNLKNLEKFFDFAKKEKIKILIHCGDVCTLETLKEIEKNFEKIYLALGNADILDPLLIERNLKTKIFEKFGKIEIFGLKIGFCHFLDLAKEIFEKEEFDFFFYGHTHKPYLIEREGKYFANPGTLGGLYFKPTFAILDLKRRWLELKILEKIK